MKKLILLLFAIIISPIAYGYEDYFLTSENPITEIENETPDILTVTEVTTLMNDKNILIIEIKKEGCGKLNLTSNNKETELKLTIKNNKVEISPSEYSFYTLDMAPGVFNLDPPPTNITAKKKETKQAGEVTSIEHIGEEE